MKDDDEAWLITVFKQKSGDKITVVKLRFTEKLSIVAPGSKLVFVCCLFGQEVV